MIRRALVALAVALVLAPMAQAAKPPGPPGPPGPDPYPAPHAGGWVQVLPPVTFVAYDIDGPAIVRETGEVMPGVYFHCHVPVRWKGKPNRYGRMTCVLVEGESPAGP